MEITEYHPFKSIEAKEQCIAAFEALKKYILRHPLENLLYGLADQEMLLLWCYYMEMQAIR